MLPKSPPPTLSYQNVPVQEPVQTKLTKKVHPHLLAGVWLPGIQTGQPLVSR